MANYSAKFVRFAKPRIYHPVVRVDNMSVTKAPGDNFNF